MTETTPPHHPPIVFAGNRLDRAGNMRRDSAWLAAKLRDERSRFLPLVKLQVPAAPDAMPSLDWRGAGEITALIEAGSIGDKRPILLGIEDGICHFAIDASNLAEGDRKGWGRLANPLALAPLLPDHEAGLLAQARALVDWHAHHGFCSVCGNPTKPEEAGYSRRCLRDTCLTQHFPRTDPVVIMAIEHGERCLLGRSKMIPQGIYTCLAGFMEPGETIEDAVRREIMEEAGVKVGRVRYHASQPWPFPGSLMIGCIGEAIDDRIMIDAHEIEEARWFSRDEVAQMLRRSTTEETPRLPPAMALAYHLAAAWVEGV